MPISGWSLAQAPVSILDLLRCSPEIKSPANLSKAFNDFWRQRNEDPEGYVYEALETYYRRVENANKMLGNTKTGWATDPGKYAVLMGVPDSIRKELYKDDSVAVWYYRNPPLIKYFLKPKDSASYFELNSENIPFL